MISIHESKIGLSNKEAGKQQVVNVLQFADSDL
jgi:hypothetical protein